jgi:diguanylate cyclase
LKSNIRAARATKPSFGELLMPSTARARELNVVEGGARAQTPASSQPDAGDAAAQRDHGYTRSLARIALEQIDALTLPADPPSYEVWYAYASGANPALNQSINTTIKASGTLSVTELDRVYEQYLSPLRFVDRVEGAGTKISDEVDQILAMLNAATGVAADYRENLADATQQLAGEFDASTVRTILDSLVQLTKDVEKKNATLEGALKSSKQQINHLQSDLEAIRVESLTDPLTAVANRKHFDQTLDQAIATTTAQGKPLSLLLLDIDHFKKFNDLHGHQLGDHVLRLVAQLVKGSIKGQDLAARYGGEEFAVILPATALPDALAVAENVRRAVKDKELIKRSTNESLGRVTVSIGAAQFRAGDTAQTLIERADKCLYAAKHRGRDRAVGENTLD